MAVTILPAPTKAREGFMARVRGPVQVVAAGSAELERVWTVSVRERRSWRARRSRLKKGMTEYARPMGRSGESRVRVARPLRMERDKAARKDGEELSCMVMALRPKVALPNEVPRKKHSPRKK